MTGLTLFVPLVLLSIVGEPPPATPPALVTTRICIVLASSQAQSGLFDKPALAHEVERIWQPYNVEINGLSAPCTSPYSTTAGDVSTPRTPVLRPATTVIVRLRTMQTPGALAASAAGRTTNAGSASASARGSGSGSGSGSDTPRGDADSHDAAADALPINTLGSIDFVGDTPRPIISLWLNEAARMLGREARELTPFNADPRFRLMLARLLGRALAHELGHYLLGSRAHTAGGLMRASYNDFDVVSAEASHFSLEPMQTSALQRRLASWREPAASVTVAANARTVMNARPGTAAVTAAGAGTNGQSTYETVPSGADALPETTSPISVTDVSPAAASVRRTVSISP
jgi:hypothetical protein